VTNGIVEMSDRRTGESSEVSIDEAVTTVAELVKTALSS
jgi:hypothetical protein